MEGFTNLLKADNIKLNKFSELIFERALIIQIDDNKDGVFDFNEVSNFMLASGTYASKEETDNYATFFFGM